MKTINMRIAIADDHAIVRKGVTDLLSDVGIEMIIQAANGKELIDKLETFTTPPDICILDINMPILDGYETIKVLNKKWPVIKTLVFTTRYNEHSLVRMLHHGAKGYILKEAELTEICDAINEIYETGVYYSRWELGSTCYKKGDKLNMKKYFLSDKEQTFLKYCCTDFCYKQIAEKMNASVRTVENYRDELFSKLNIKSRVGLVLYAINSGLITIPVL